MSKQNIQANYNTVCSRLGELEYRLTQLQAEKSSLIKQAAELQKSWAMVEAMEKEAQGHASVNVKEVAHDGPSA